MVRKSKAPGIVIIALVAAVLLSSGCLQTAEIIKQEPGQLCAHVTATTRIYTLELRDVYLDGSFATTQFVIVPVQYEYLEIKVNGVVVDSYETYGWPADPPKTEFDVCRDASPGDVMSYDLYVNIPEDIPGDVPGDEPAPTCYDGVMNGLETGVDCGGPCSACYVQPPPDVPPPGPWDYLMGIFTLMINSIRGLFGLPPI